MNTDSTMAYSNGSSTVSLILAVIAVIALWATFTKAGRPGWGAIIPFYNLYLLAKIAGRPGWWVILFFIPIVNIVITLLISLDVARAFGKSTVFGVVGLWLFSVIGYLIVGFGSARYQGQPRH